MTKAEMFVNELIDYIFAYPDDDWVSMEVLCRKLYKHDLITKKDGEWIGEYLEQYEPKTEPQPRCPKCGKRGYIRSLESMGVKLKHFDEYKWKCTNCNKYFKEEPKDEPQTDWKDQMWTEAIETEKTEPQTEREGE